MTNAVFWLSFLLFFVSLLRSFLIFDRIVRHEHDAHPEFWGNDGKPIGYFWIPEGAKPSLEGYRTRYRVYVRLFLKTPAWVTTDAEHRLLLGFRLWWIIAPLSGLAALVAFFRIFFQAI